MMLKGELVRINTKDNLELQGILFEPKVKKDVALIHVHGWVGNFYENKLIESIAGDAAAEGIAFLSFNNRGAGIVTEFRKKPKSNVIAGGSLEKFEECIIDIKAAVDFLSRRGYSKIFLQGHSLGCQKITYYKYKTGDKRVKGLVLLGPVDDVAYVKKALGRMYEESLKIVREMVKNGKLDETVPKWMQFYRELSACVFFNIADPKSISGSLFDYSGGLKEISNVKCPVLAIFGSEDEYQEKPEQKLRLLRDKTGCDVKLVKGANHGFLGYESKLEFIAKWIKSVL